MSAHARLYQSVRTAHLERARELTPATIVFAERRYDFDQELAQSVELVDGRGWRAARHLLKNPPSVLEINEPLMLESALWTLFTVTTLRLRARVTRSPRPRIVTYAIENRAADGNGGRRMRTRVKTQLRRVAAGVLWRHCLDRVAFGTADAQELYVAALGHGRHVESRLIWALPAAVRPTVEGRERIALFVSALSERKGVDILLDSWQTVRAAVPDARLMIIGKGPLVDDVRRACAADPTMRLVIDPPRRTIHEALARARILVLPSRRTPTWREQVGLPIVEGLAHGCTVVTTTETGLAQWLRDHGHQVVAPGDAESLGAALIAGLVHPLPLEAVLGSLPERDGRLAVDDWLFEPSTRRR